MEPNAALVALPLTTNKELPVLSLDTVFVTSTESLGEMEKESGVLIVTALLSAACAVPPPAILTFLVDGWFVLSCVMVAQGSLAMPHAAVSSPDGERYPVSDVCGKRKKRILSS